ncbi:hypothetical protein HYC85_005549 [Camellia sinensis]|uniref:NPH3 domain-containing protein n=1 Tax=Camellia sinensis TaxID=4442 RepID=A0A7J7I1R0_CAMSI|nr:hypothetical protein HYC85_005549 [Camellia sinensis]
MKNGNDPHLNRIVPKDWWVEDLCDLQIDLYKRVITMIKTKGKMSGDVIKEALKAYVMRRLSGFNNGTIQGDDVIKNRMVVVTSNLAPSYREKQLLQVSIALKCREIGRKELKRRIVADLLIRAQARETTIYDIDIEIRRLEFVSNASTVKLAKLIDGYLAKIGKDPNLPLSKFVGLAQMVSDFSRLSHDGLYNAIDML